MILRTEPATNSRRSCVDGPLRSVYCFRRIRPEHAPSRGAAGEHGETGFKNPKLPHSSQRGRHSVVLLMAYFCAPHNVQSNSRAICLYACRRLRVREIRSAKRRSSGKVS
jgi:hypothetical protein